MRTWTIIKEVVIILLILSIYRCIPMEQVTLYGDIIGQVTDAETSEPLQAAAIKLDPSDETTSTGSDGKYLFKNLTPGNYEIEVSKQAYEKKTKNTTVTSANTTEINFALNGVPYPEISDSCLDFGLDSISKSFTISNSGKGNFHYELYKSQDWITLYPDEGDVIIETDTIKVTINRTGLSEKKHKGIIRIISYCGADIIQDTVDVLLNGVMDQDGNYYSVVTIGTQTWMAENLNTGTAEIALFNEPWDNGIIEKYCYDCETYGGLYTWGEFMKNNPSDTGEIGTTQGICPDGWHIPTVKEWGTLIAYAGGEEKAGERLKETGTQHWEAPNFATDEYGFTALPGGWAARGGNPDLDPTHTYFSMQGRGAAFGTSCVADPPQPEWPGDYWVCMMISYLTSTGVDGRWFFYEATSIRCVKDP